MRKVLSVIICIAMLMTTASLVASADTGVADTLKFNENGNFRILHITDLQDDMVLNPVAKNMIKAAIENEKPDLIVLGGDNISGGSCEGGISSVDRGLSRNAIDQFMSIFEKYGVPVAGVFGNHDNENGVSKEELLEMYQAYDCYIGYDADPELYGCGTYNLPIYASDGSGKINYNLWLFDSNTYDEENGGYDYVHDDQVQWYVNKSNELKALNGGEPVASMAFQHIVVREIFDTITVSQTPVENSIEREDGYHHFAEEYYKSGELNEYPCPPTVKSTQFSAMKAQGDVVAMFFGHDHTNTFIVNYQGIDLSTSPGFTFHSYGNHTRGMRVIDINEKDTSAYETYIVHWHTYFGESKIAMNQYNMYAGDVSLWEQIKATIAYIFTAPINWFFGYVF